MMYNDVFLIYKHVRNPPHTLNKKLNFQKIAQNYGYTYDMPKLKKIVFIYVNLWDICS